MVLFSTEFVYRGLRLAQLSVKPLDRDLTTGINLRTRPGAIVN